MTLQAVDALGADSAPTAILDRVSLVLDAFDGPGRLTLAQVVRSTGLPPRSSAHRMLERLVSMRWLRRDGRDYELGMRLVELGSLAVHQDRLHAAAMPLLHELYRVTGFVVHLGILDGPDVVYMEKIGGRLAAAVPTRVGGRRRAETTAIGQALLAFGSPKSPRATHCPPPRQNPRVRGWPSNPETAYRDSAVLRHRSAHRPRRRRGIHLRAVEGPPPRPRQRSAGPYGGRCNLARHRRRIAERHSDFATSSSAAQHADRSRGA